jgi:small GTP-binding protein
MNPWADLRKLLTYILRRPEANVPESESAGAGQSNGFGLAAILNALDWDHVREEVERESRARIVLIGAPDAGKSTLLNQLKGFPVSPPPPDADELSEPRVEDMGLFTAIDIPPCSPGGQSSEASPTWSMLQGADLILWMIDGAAGVRRWEHEWISRIRAMGRPLTVVLNKLDQARQPGEVERLSRTLACPVIPIAARDGTNVATLLLPHIVDASPNLATALGREVLAWRRIAAQRVTRRAMVLSGLAGVEPVPLLDIPFQVLLQLRLVLRLAAIYGEPVGDRYNRELLATMVSGAALRYLGQQAVKLLPILGWGASGALAASGTWAIGKIATEYFESGRQLRKRQAGGKRQEAGSRLSDVWRRLKAALPNRPAALRRLRSPIAQLHTRFFRVIRVHGALHRMCLRPERKARHGQDDR